MSLLWQVKQEKVQHPGSHTAQAPIQACHLQHVVLGPSFVLLCQCAVYYAFPGTISLVNDGPYASLWLDFTSLLRKPSLILTHDRLFFNPLFPLELLESFKFFEFYSNHGQWLTKSKVQLWRMSFRVLSQPSWSVCKLGRFCQRDV